MKRRLKKVLLVSLGISLLTLTLVVTGLRWQVKRVAFPLISSCADVQEAPAALIFGAYVYPNGTPCKVLQDRLDMGLSLYKEGKVEKLIVSGDHGSAHYDEVNAMADYLQARGVPAKDLFLAHAGFDTYDSIYRARDVFGAEELVLVTQDFHLKRALYIAQSLGLKAQGVPADRRQIPEIRSLETRELAANVKAFLDLSRRRKPVYLGEKISLEEDASATHDRERS